jgi:hypothetical protein
MRMTVLQRYREIAESRRPEALAKGYKHRYFFPHLFRYLPKCGPDGFKLALRMCGPIGTDASWEIVLYAANDAISDLPADLFADDEIVWHQQHFGRLGHIASANLVLDGHRLFSFVHISDLVQRVSRRREYKTRVEARFKGWHRMLLNAIMNFAVESRCAEVLIPTAEFALQNTALLRRPKAQMFHRLYDHDTETFYSVTCQGHWRVLNVEDNRERIIIAKRQEDTLLRQKRICVCHDVEADLGSTTYNVVARKRARQSSSAAVSAMLKIEADVGIKATYNVVGCLLPSVQQVIRNEQHCISFHSFDHRVDKRRFGTALVAWIAERLLAKPFQQPVRPTLYQLRRCRTVDYRVKGYRVPQSRITGDLTPENLCYHNFEWLASSVRSLGITEPTVKNRLVYIPIHFDDWPLHSRRRDYISWEKRAIATIRAHHFVAFCLHDCYADRWLPFYERFLCEIRELGVFSTLDDVAAETFLTAAV